jgi:phospholipid-translocating ATPase
LLEGDFSPTCSVPPSSIRVGDLVLLESAYLLTSSCARLTRRELASSAPTRQRDRLESRALPYQRRRNCPPDHELLNLDAGICVASLKSGCILLFAHTPDAPSKDIHMFVGTFTINTPPSVSSNEVPMVQVPTVESLSAENVLRANTVLVAPLSALWSILGQRRALR